MSEAQSNAVMRAELLGQVEKALTIYVGPHVRGRAAREILDTILLRLLSLRPGNFPHEMTGAAVAGWADDYENSFLAMISALNTD